MCSKYFFFILVLLVLPLIWLRAAKFTPSVSVSLPEENPKSKFVSDDPSFTLAETSAHHFCEQSLPEEYRMDNSFYDRLSLNYAAHSNYHRQIGNVIIEEKKFFFKIFDFEKDNRPNNKRFFVNEVHFLSRLYTEGNFYFYLKGFKQVIFTPFFEGKTFLELTEKDDKPQVFLQFAKKLLNLHQESIVHGDLKHANTILNKGGETVSLVE